MSLAPEDRELLDDLEAGRLRVAEPDGAGGWRVKQEIKRALLELFKKSPLIDYEGAAGLSTFRDKAAFPLRRFEPEHGVRLVPGGSAVRRGSYLAPGVVCMPPMYVNVGAYVGRETMIDSHALVGSCAQVGERVHLSAAAQLGGVLEPPAALPVIIEDEVFVGGGCGIYEGVRVGRAAVLAAGVVLTATTRVYDLVHERELCGTREEPLAIPERAVVVPGTRPLGSDWARKRGLQVACAHIVKYRDASTDSRTALEDALR